ncbi:helix-turn-helix transcriptional regulator [Leptolyngbya sp. FACHB-261]|nr:helix-turn-helix transcriptional regulator [Leptolyngbya sp. FACHB-261]
MPNKHYDCPIEAIVDVVGGKWKLPILYYLFQKTQRFGELKRQIPGVTERMLALQLRELEQAGIVKRTVYAEVPPRVEYALTALGLTLEPTLRTMLDWSENYLRIKEQVDEQNLASILHS